LRRSSRAFSLKSLKSLGPVGPVSTTKYVKRDVKETCTHAKRTQCTCQKRCQKRPQKHKKQYTRVKRALSLPSRCWALSNLSAQPNMSKEMEKRPTHMSRKLSKETYTYVKRDAKRAHKRTYSCQKSRVVGPCRICQHSRTCRHSQKCQTICQKSPNMSKEM